MKKNLYLILFLIPLTILSCKEDNKEVVVEKNHLIAEAQNFIDYMMDDVYLWNDKIVDIENKNYDNIFNYFTDIRYQDDKYSFMMSGEDYNLSESGLENRDFGVQYMQPTDFFGDYSVKVAYVFPDSPFGKKGVQRGWTLTHIDDTAVEKLIENGTINNKLNSDNSEFKFIDLNNNIVTIKDKKTLYHKVNVLNSKVFTSVDYAGLNCKVGYFNYLSFKSGEGMLEEITREFAKIQTQNIDELILDLRYNQGGEERAIEHLANLLAPSNSQQKVFLKTKYNTKNSKHNKDNFLINRNALSLDLKRIFILTSKYTASASEVIINGLRSFMDVQLVGRTTYGKPYGMIIIPYPYDSEDFDLVNAEYIFLPVCMRSYNNNNETFDKGFVPTNLRYDDLYNDFGVKEDYINACLHKIINGTYPIQSKSKTKSSSGSVKGGVEMEKEYEKENYGKYYIKR